MSPRRPSGRATHGWPATDGQRPLPPLDLLAGLDPNAFAQVELWIQTWRDSKAIGGVEAAQRRITISSTALGSVIPFAYGTVKIPATFAWYYDTAPHYTTGNFYVAFAACEGEVGAVSTIYINDQDVSGLGWITNYGSKTGTASQSAPSLWGSNPDAYPGLCFPYIKIDKTSAEIPGNLVCAILTTGRKIYPFRTGGANAVSSNPVVQMYDQWTSEEALDLDAAVLDVGTGATWNARADWCDQLMADGTARWATNIIIETRDGWAALDELAKHAWLEFESHTGTMRLLANKPPDQYCLYCAGDTGKYATIAHHADLNMAAGRGLEWWWKPAETGIADGYGINKGNNFSIRYNATDNTVTVSWVDGGSSARSYTYVPTVDQLDGDWHHWRAEWDSDGVTTRLFRDSVEVGGATFGGSQFPATTTTNIYVGRASSAGLTPLKQWISDLRIYHTTRTEAEIAADMFVRLAGTETNLVAYLPMNESSGTNLDDRTTGAHDGTISGAALVTRHVPLYPETVDAEITADDWIEEPEVIYASATSVPNVTAVAFTDGASWEDDRDEQSDPDGIVSGELRRVEVTLSGATSRSMARRWNAYNLAQAKWRRIQWVGAVNAKAANLVRHDLVLLSTRDGADQQYATVQEIVDQNQTDNGRSVYKCRFLQFHPRAYPEVCEV